jgi:c(7)-type cytochrome triheme protein
VNRIPRNRLVWGSIAGAVAVVILLVAAYLLLASKARAAPTQPIAFNHQLMVGAGVPCLYCHADALTSPAPGVPSVQKCMGCHSVIGTDRPEIVKLAGYWQRQEPIPWVLVNRLPRFVRFSHQVHVGGAGLNCERCHGDVGQMTETYQVETMTMGWCLRCHTQQPAAAQLRDCGVCHY